MTTPKNPSAVALGRLGGLKGGKARADKLTSKQWSEMSAIGGLTAITNRKAKMKEKYRAMLASLGFFATSPQLDVIYTEIEATKVKYQERKPRAAINAMKEVV